MSVAEKLNPSAFATPFRAEQAAQMRGLANSRVAGLAKRIGRAFHEDRKIDNLQQLQAIIYGNESHWRPEIGIAEDWLNKSRSHIALLQLAMGLAGAGGSGKIQVDIDQATSFFFEGYYFSLKGECKFEFGKNVVKLETKDLNIDFKRSSENSRWLMRTNELESAFIVREPVGQIPRYFSATGLYHQIEGFPWPDNSDYSKSAKFDSLASANTLDAGWNTILAHVPEYGPWIARTLSGVLLFSTVEGDDLSKSGSAWARPGLVAIALTEDRPEFAGEILVHECSHQTLLIYMLGGALQHSDGDLIYSPIKRTHRPAQATLLGAHAVGNMILYYRNLDSRNKLQTLSSRRLDELESWFAEDYMPGLDACTSLTSHGEHLWKALRHEVIGIH